MLVIKIGGGPVVRLPMGLFKPFDDLLEAAAHIARQGQVEELRGRPVDAVLERAIGGLESDGCDQCAAGGSGSLFPGHT